MLSEPDAVLVDIVLYVWTTVTCDQSLILRDRRFWRTQRVPPLQECRRQKCRLPICYSSSPTGFLLFCTELFIYDRNVNFGKPLFHKLWKPSFWRMKVKMWIGRKDKRGRDKVDQTLAYLLVCVSMSRSGSRRQWPSTSSALSARRQGRVPHVLRGVLIQLQGHPTQPNDRLSEY